MRRFAAFGVLLVLACASSGGGETPPARTVDESHPGYSTYRQYCGACHGVFADGKGPVAPLLTPPPFDLSRLGERYGMPLPRAEIARFVSGERPVRAHGPTDMPIWGDRLLEGVPESAGKTFGKRGRILLILDYLESVQRVE
jgi:mono/diheme cytochrome c family protein